MSLSFTDEQLASFPPEARAVIRTLLAEVGRLTARLAELEKLIVANHPYDTPEFLVLPLDRGNKRYLNWLNGSVW